MRLRLRLGSTWPGYVLIVALTATEGTLAILVPPYLRSQGYDFSTIGILVAILGVMALCSRLPAGMIYQPARARGIMAMALIALGATTLLYPLAVGPALFGLVRALNGLAAGTATTLNLAMYMDAIPTGGDKARAMGLYGGLLAAGYMVGNFSGGVAGDFLGYSLSFSLAALFAFVALILLLVDRTTPTPAAKPQSVPALETRPLETRLATILRPFQTLSEPRVAALSLIAFGLNFMHQVGATFFPLYGVSIGLSLTEIGFIRAAHAMTNAIARPLAGPPISRFGHRRVSYVGLTLLAGVLAFIPTLHAFTPLLGLFVVVGLLRAVVLVANTIGIADIDEARMSRGLASGLYNASKDLGNLTGPVVCGAVASLVGLTTMFGLVPPLATLIFFGMIARLRGRPRAATSTGAGSSASGSPPPG